MSIVNSIISLLDPEKIQKQLSVSSWICGKKSTEKNETETIQNKVSKTDKENTQSDDNSIIVITVTNKSSNIIKNLVKRCQQPVADKLINNFFGMGFVEENISNPSPA